jgi:radical SAM superfamily enzyme YgiQ (UPF0313 family)
LIEFNAVWIGFSSLSYQSNVFIRDLCYAIKSIKPAQQIIVGGQGLSEYERDSTPYKNNKTVGDVWVETGLVDTFIVDHSENILVDVLSKNLKGKIKDPNSYTKEGFNNLPTPSYIDYKVDEYKNHAQYYWQTDGNETAATIVGSKGCVRKCTFCSIHIFNPKFVFKSGEKMANDMIKIYEQQGITNFFLVDSLMNGSMKQWRDFMSTLIKKVPNKFKYFGDFIVRPKHQHSEEDFHMMSESGCEYVQVGIESGSERVRLHMGKKHTQDDLHHMIQSLVKYKVKQGWNLMVGYPTETQEDFNETCKLVLDYKDVPKPYILAKPTAAVMVVPGTPLYDKHWMDLGLEWEIPNPEGAGTFQYWTSKTNPTNTPEWRLKSFIQLLDLCYEHGHLFKYQYEMKKENHLHLLHYYYKNRDSLSHTLKENDRIAV